MHTKNLLLSALAIAVICLSATCGLLLFYGSPFTAPNIPPTETPTPNPTSTVTSTPELTQTPQPTPQAATSGLSPPNFSLQYADASYDVPITPSSTIDPFTGKTIDTSTGGYHVTNRTVTLTIKNPYINSGASSVYFNVRYKGHFGTEWTTLYPHFDLGYPQMDTASAYTKIVYASGGYSNGGFWGTNPSEAVKIDFQVQVLVGNASICFYEFGDPWYFHGETGDWSGTQTVEIPPI